MRVSRDQVQENKQKILKAAGRLFRERGFDAVTVAEVMKAAGLTHGGFYGYFASKSELIAEAMADVLTNGPALPDGLESALEQYLAAPHRDDAANGCLMAALASEATRQPGPARTQMTLGLEAQIKQLMSLGVGAPDQRRRAAIATWSAMIGGLILSRLSEDPALSEEILSETRTWLLEKNGRTPPAL